MTEGGGPAGQPFADEAFAVAAGAYAQAAGEWEQAIRATIAALFDFLAERPEQTAACLGGDGTAERDGLARRDATIDRFVMLLNPGFAGAPLRPPPVVAEAIGGGIYELVRSHVLERRLDDLPSAASDATTVALSPFIGSDAAIGHEAV